ncbi:hypothetical protein FY034_17360 (plasmid) [Trichlorobacter lovleyi]|uniref:hypothetical protein n=1 Tax=Trichlorobacter lovleyi TaxID=313985 RepID=UPI002240A19E|nr:hypothetical protein [Trichlorobacter lovleyi]QOX80792.1 hypothetical protein FY034_17360 [Trichlorobacter lovleyi]
MPGKKTKVEAQDTVRFKEKTGKPNKKTGYKAKGTGATEKGGRPGSSEPRTKKFIHRMSLSERRDLDNSCRNLGLDPSSFVRMAVLTSEYLQTFDKDIVAAVEEASVVTEESLFMAFTGAEFYRLLGRSKAYETSVNNYCRLATAQLCKYFSSRVEPLGPPIDMSTPEGKLMTTAESMIERVKASLGLTAPD